MSRESVLRGLVVLAGTTLAGCNGEDPCTAIAKSNGIIVAADTSMIIGPCVGTVYLDSVGSDTTASGVRVLYSIDSVGSDTTEN